MTKFSDILAGILQETFQQTFTTAAPCSECRRAVPTYRDRETGRHYCLPCLEAAVEVAQAEIVAERHDIARQAACFGQRAA